MSNRAQQVVRSELEGYLLSLERRVRQLEERLQALEARAEKFRALETRVARLDGEFDSVRAQAVVNGEPELSSSSSGFRFKAPSPR